MPGIAAEISCSTLAADDSAVYSSAVWFAGTVAAGASVTGRGGNIRIGSTEPGPGTRGSIFTGR
jgi:hypothetical protein